MYELFYFILSVHSLYLPVESIRIFIVVKVTVD